MKRHISILGKEIQQYFPDLEDFRSIMVFVNLFGTTAADLPSQDNLHQEQFIDLVNDGNSRNLFSEKSCSEFGLKWHKPTLTFRRCLESTNSISNNIRV